MTQSLPESSETMALSMVNFVSNLTVCQPHDLNEGERDSRDSATSADNSMGGAGAKKYSKPDSASRRYIPDASAIWLNFTLRALGACHSQWGNGISLFLMRSNNAEEESNGRGAAKQRNQGLKPGFKASHDLNKY